jgi:UPF0042 nucleotide-binding protein
MTQRMLVVVVTGLSGAGKTTAVSALEDLGFFCIDNLPPPVVEATLGSCASAGLQRVAIVIDVRSRSFLGQAPMVIDALPHGGERDLMVLFLDASDAALLRRFGSTRRPHPLSAGTGADREAPAVIDGIRLERERLSPLRARATFVVDSTELNVHELRRRVVQSFGAREDGSSGIGMRTRVLSFGFKYGAPIDADLVFDVRFLPNPFFVEHLKELGGTDAPVAEFVMNSADAQEWLEKVTGLLEFCVPRFEREGKSYLTVAVGCTGGRHRSVALAEALGRTLRSTAGSAIEVLHRDLGREALSAQSVRTGGW